MRKITEPQKFVLGIMFEHANLGMPLSASEVFYYVELVANSERTVRSLSAVRQKLDRLLRDGYVKKTGGYYYSITDKGRQEMAK